MVQEDINKEVNRNKESAGEFVMEWDNSLSNDTQELANLSFPRLKELAVVLKQYTNVTMVKKLAQYHIVDGHSMEPIIFEASLKELLKSVLNRTIDWDSKERHVARKALENLLKAEVGRRQEFLDLKPLHDALRKGNIKVVKILRKDPTFCTALKKEDNLTDPSYPEVTELSLAIALDDIDRLNSAPELLALQESKDFKPKDFKPKDLMPFLEEAWQYGSQKVAQELENIYFQRAKNELVGYFTKELPDKTIITTQDTNKMKKDVIELLSSVSFKEDKSDVKEVAGAIVREAATIFNTPLDWKTRLFKIKDVIKDHLPKIFLNTKVQKIKQILKDKELQKTLTTLPKKTKNTAQTTPFLTSYNKLPER